jgi:hypothetical protein
MRTFALSFFSLLVSCGATDADSFQQPIGQWSTLPDGSRLRVLEEPTANVASKLRCWRVGDGWDCLRNTRFAPGQGPTSNMLERFQRANPDDGSIGPYSRGSDAHRSEYRCGFFDGDVRGARHRAGMSESEPVTTSSAAPDSRVRMELSRLGAEAAYFDCLAVAEQIEHGGIETLPHSMLR